MRIKSPRLYTKLLTEENIDKGWLDWVNDESVTKYLSVKPPISKLDLIQYLNDNKVNGDLLLAIYKDLGSEYIGNLRIYNINKVDKTLMYGRIIGNENNRNKGYGTEILNIICFIAFEHYGLDFAYTRINKNNIGSKKSNMKIGKLIYPSDIFWDNKENLYSYEVGFVISKKEWQTFFKHNKTYHKLM